MLRPAHLGVVDVAGENAKRSRTAGAGTTWTASRGCSNQAIADNTHFPERECANGYSSAGRTFSAFHFVWEDPGLFAVFVGFLVGTAVFLVAPSRTASVRVAVAATLAALLALGLILLVQRPPKEMRVAIAQIRHSGGFVGQSDDPGTTYRDAWSVDFGVRGVNDERLLAISPHLRTLPKLWLHLSNCSVGDHGLAGLANAGNLEWLNLDGTRVTDAGLIHLSQLNNLRFLDLGRTQVSDEGLRSLSSLLNLKTLLLHRTAVTENGVRELQELLENCVIRGPGREPMQRRVGP